MPVPKIPFKSWLKKVPLCEGRHLGLDIGGANLKAVQLAVRSNELVVEFSASKPFALWKTPKELSRAVRDLVSTLPDPDSVSITMTGEIADCYPTKLDGVVEITEACQRAFEDDSQRPGFYSQDPIFQNEMPQHFFSGVPTPSNYLSLAASNWHAVANLFGKWLGESENDSGLLIDLGSTTCDITPASTTAPYVSAATDWQRIQMQQLIYSGVGRSPLACLASQVKLPTVHHNASVYSAQELFATARDAYLVLGDAKEDVNDLNTADGRPATTEFAAQRIARMFCSDVSELPERFILSVAETAKANQMSIIHAAINEQIAKMPSCGWIAVCGEGESQLAQLIALEFPLINCLRLSKVEGVGCSDVAPAFAVAALRALGPA